MYVKNVQYAFAATSPSLFRHRRCSTKRGKMPRGIKKHLKRVNAPSHWMLDKLGGVFVSIPRFLYFYIAFEWISRRASPL